MEHPIVKKIKNVDCARNINIIIYQDYKDLRLVKNKSYLIKHETLQPSEFHKSIFEDRNTTSFELLKIHTEDNCWNTFSNKKRNCFSIK